MGDMEGWHVTGIATAVTSGDAEARLEQWTGDGKGDSGRVAWRTTRSAGPPGRADPWARAPGRVLRPGFFGPTDERAEEQGKEFLTLPSTLTTILANSELSMGTQGARVFCTLAGCRHGVVTPVERLSSRAPGQRLSKRTQRAPYPTRPRRASRQRQRTSGRFVWATTWNCSKPARVSRRCHTPRPRLAACSTCGRRPQQPIGTASNPGTGGMPVRVSEHALPQRVQTDRAACLSRGCPRASPAPGQPIRGVSRPGRCPSG